MRTTLLLLSALSLFGADPKPSSRELQERLDWEIAARAAATIQVAQMQAAQMQAAMEAAAKDRREALLRICTAHGLNADTCVINESKREITKQEPAPPAKIDAKAPAEAPSK